MEQINFEEIRKEIRSCDMLLIGIGQEFSEGSGEEKAEAGKKKQVLDRLAAMVSGLNYFVLTGNRDGLAETVAWRKDAVAAPMYREDGEAWERYMKWLGYTLNRRLLVLELGEGFLNPAVMRWPFERMVMINQKARLLRVGKTFSQIPEEIGEKGQSIPILAADFIEGLWRAEQTHSAEK